MGVSGVLAICGGRLWLDPAACGGGRVPRLLGWGRGRIGWEEEWKDGKGRRRRGPAATSCRGGGR